MLKHIFYLFILLSISSYINIVFAQENPLIYQTFIRDDFDSTNGGYISIISPLTFSKLAKIDLPTASAQTIVIAPDKKLAFVNGIPFVDPKKGLVVIDLETKKEKVRMFESIGVYGIKLAPNGMLWALLNETEEIVIIDPRDLSIESRIKLEEAPRDVVFSFDDKDRRAYVSSVNSNVFVYNYVTRGSITAIRNLPKGDTRQTRPQELELSPDGKTLYIGSDDTISIADTTTNIPIRVTHSFPLPKTTFGDFLIKASKDGKFIYVAEYLGSDLYAYNTETKLIRSFRTPGNRGTINALNIPLNTDILYIIEDYGISLYDINSQSFVTTMKTSSGVGFPNPFSGGATLTGDFSIGQAPTLKVNSPSANDNFVVNQNVSIQWQTIVAQQSYSLANHTVELSTDGGQTFAPIAGAEQLPGNVQEFTWVVPNIEVINKAQICVSTVDLGARRASSTTDSFSILKMPIGDTQVPTVTFLSPKGGEQFTAGNALQISWTSDDNVGVTSQDLSLSTDGGSTFPLTIASGLVGTTQSFSFPIPATLQTDQVRLRLIVKDSAGNSAQALTPANFRIELGADTVVPTVTISQPTSNQSLIAGQPIQVKWQSTDNRVVANQALLISFDGGNNFLPVASFGANDNSFVINNIDQLNLTNSQTVVRITATDSSSNVGQADAEFVLTPAIMNATYKSKLLTLVGIGFMGNSDNNTIKVFINNKEVPLNPMSLSNTSFSLKGNKKKLGIVRGNNIVKLVVNGIDSNSLMFIF